MLPNFQSGVVRNIQVEVQVTNPDQAKVLEIPTVPVQVTVNEYQASASMMISTEQNSSISVSQTIATGKASGSANNVDSLDQVKPFFDEITAKIKLVVNEVNA